ncbi:MAG: peroxiredoxin [Pseudochelatococcus sp.]|jgi:peroxiredoxin|uniref:peroxiredoxin n=1 Tax=Pseudochelatococcus sp. TaxID=2020869 RepID=UPI003D905C46
MTIAVGERLPQTTFRVMTADGPAPRTTDDIFKGRRVVLVGVPGAFTPTCHRNHAPGFVANVDTFREKGIDAVLLTSVNDVFVLEAWSKALGADGKVEFLADGSADFARATGLLFDGSGFGLGPRSQRYAMIVNDGVVEALNVEEASGQVQVAGAEHLLERL